MTNPERILNLQKLGYTEREAAFLTLAALHSGYCLRRQFNFFASTVDGQIATNFFTRATTLRHAKPVTYRGDRIIYHLASKPLFEALGETDNRNRRNHDTQTIKRRIMALDYVLQHSDLTFYATETERVALFESQELDRGVFPVKRYNSPKSTGITARYFIEKFPIATNSDGVIHISYIDEGLHTTSGFERFLQQYSPLIRQLSRSRFVFIAPHNTGFSRAETVFIALLRSSTVPLSPELMSYFQDRVAFETGLLEQGGLIRYRDHKERFAGPQFDSAFTKWKTDPSLTSRPISSGECQFSTYRLQFNYDLFGTSLQLGDSGCNSVRSKTQSAPSAAITGAIAVSRLVVRKSYKD